MGVSWGGDSVCVGGVTGICAEHFLYNENNLTNCSTQRNSPPIPHIPPPLLHHNHYITISKPRVQSKSSLSRMGMRHRERGGEDKTEAAGVDPRPSWLLFLFSVCMRDRKYMWVCQHKCMFVSKKRLQKIWGDTRGLLIGSSTSCTEEKSIHIPEAHNGACRGSDGVTQKCQSRYTALLGGQCMADDQQGRSKDKKSLYFMVGMFTSDMSLLLTYLYVLFVFPLSLLYEYSQALPLVCWETKRENQSEWH